MKVSPNKKDIKAYLDTRYSMYSCLQLMRQLPIESQPNYSELLNSLRSLMNEEEIIFSWRGIEHPHMESDSSSSHLSVNPMEKLLFTLSPQALKLLDLEKPFERKHESINGLPNWDVFRALMQYFIECVQQDAGAAADHFDETEGDQFIYLPLFGDWMPKANKSFYNFVPFNANHEKFLQRLANLDPATPLVLGYPTETWMLPQTHKDIPRSAKVRPVFQFKVSYDPYRRCFYSDDPVPEVNTSWLKNRIKTMDKKQAFLKSCGFIDVYENSENFLSGASLSLTHLISTLSALFPNLIKENLFRFSIPNDSLKGRSSGIYNRAVLMLGKPGRYVKTLVSELKFIADRPEEELSQTALGALFFGDLKSKEISPKSHDSIVMDTMNLNANQRQAVASLQQEDISVITGPPGTGKSQVAAATIANMRLGGNSVLFASKNHKAIDAVMGRLKIEDGSPYVIRTNSKDDPNLKVTFQTAIRLLLEGTHDIEAEKQSTELMEEIDSLLELRSKQNSIATKIQHFKDKMSQEEEKASFHALHLPDEICQTINNRIGTFPHHLVTEYEQIVNLLKKDSLLNRIFTYFRLIQFKLKSCIKLRIKDIPKISWMPWKYNFSLIERDFLTLKKMGLYSEAMENSSKLTVELRPFPATDILSKEIFDLSEKIQTLTQRILPLDLKARGSGIPAGEKRHRLANLRSALRFLNSGMLNRSVKQSLLDQSKKDISLLLSHAPCWAVTNLSAGSRLPLVGGMFDLTIIDEASQCDMVSAIPLLYRSRRAGVIGDPCQLRHIANLGTHQDAFIRQKVGFTEYSLGRFSYMETSLYDLFSEISNVQPVFLDETYRSHIEIAQYSNEIFYHNKLRVALDPKHLNIPKGKKPGLHWTSIEGEILRGGPSGCYSTDECDVVIQKVCELIDTGFRGSIGVVTPFREQANRINDRLYEQSIPQDIIQETGLHINTSHGFQGDEKDVIFFSLCAGPNMPKGSVTWLKNQGNLFNVAVSRARAILHVIGNRDWASNCGIEHIERLTISRSANESNTEKGPWFPHDSPWEKVLYKALVEKGLEPIPQYPVAGRRLDLALVRANDKPLKLDIEVDGDRYHRSPDGSRKQEDIWRDYQLRSLGWKVKRFWVYQLREDLEDCVNAILKIWRDTNDPT